MAFKERGKPEKPKKKNPRNKEENQQQIQPTYGVDAGSRNRATYVGGETRLLWSPPLLPTLTHARKYHFHKIEIDGFSTWEG